MAMSWEINDAIDDLERISLRMGILREHKRDWAGALNKALESPETRGKIKQAANDIEDFCRNLDQLRKHPA